MNIFWKRKKKKAKEDCPKKKETICSSTLISTIPVNTTPRKLKVKWTVDIAEELRTYGITDTTPEDTTFSNFYDEEYNGF